MIVYNNQSGLTNVYLGTINMSKVYIGDYQVYPSSTPPTPSFKFKFTLTDSSVVTGECNSTSAITTANTSYYKNTLVSAEIGNCVTSIGNNAFEVPNGLVSSFSSVTIPDSVTTFGSYVFHRCSGLTSVVLPNSITSMGSNTFKECRQLTSVNIPTGLTEIPVSFAYNCHSLQSIEIPSGITSIGVGAFYNCSGLTSITVNATTPPTLGSTAFDNTNNCPIYVPCQSVNAYKTAWSTYEDRIQCVQPTSNKFEAFYNDSTTYSEECDSDSTLRTGTTRTGGLVKYSGMTSAVVGDCITTLDTSAFAYCRSLTSVTLSDSVTSFGGGVFRNCYSLTSVGVKGSGASVEIPSGMTSFSSGGEFDSCTGLTSVTLGNQITEIGYTTFSNCSGLTSVTIPSGVTLIDGYAFAGCSGLTSVTVNATVPPSSNGATSNWYAFNNTNNCPIYVPSGSVNAYKSASGWSSYASRIYPIP